MLHYFEILSILEYKSCNMGFFSEYELKKILN